jgi:hypothetical protein
LTDFQKDLKNFEAKFGNPESNANFIPQNRGAAGPGFGQDATNNRPTTFNQFRLNSFDNPKPEIPISKPTVTPTRTPRVTPFTIFNKPSQRTTPQPRLTKRQKMLQKSTSQTKISPIKATNIPVTSNTEKEQNKNSESFSIPVETTKKITIDVKMSSETTENRSIKNEDELPISTFFNESKKDGEAYKKTMDNKNIREFPIFDAVPK